MKAPGKKKKAGSRPQEETVCTRRSFIQTVGGLLISSSALGTGLLQPESIFAAPRRREINIGTFGPSHCAAPFVYTQLKDFFKSEKLKVNLVNYPTMPGIAKDLARGKLDFGQLVAPLALAMHTGAKPFNSPTPVVITQIAGTNGSALMVRNGSGIDGPKDFKGMTVASHSKMGVNYLINMMFLEKNKLDYKKDVKFKLVGLKDMIKAMKDGEVDAFVMPEPVNAMTEDKGIGRVKLLSKYLWWNHPCCSLVTRKEMFDKDRALVASVTRMMTKGGLLINEKETRGETVDFLRSTQKYRYNTIPRNVLMRAFVPGRADFYPFPYQSSALVIIEIMKRYGLLPRAVNDKKLAKEVFLSDFSRMIMKDVGAKPPKSNYRAEKILGKVKTFS